MGKLKNATKILTELEIHMAAKISTAIIKASHKAYAEALTELIELTLHYDGQYSLAIQTIEASTKFKNRENLVDSFNELNELKKEINTRRVQIAQLTVEYSVALNPKIVIDNIPKNQLLITWPPPPPAPIIDPNLLEISLNINTPPERDYASQFLKLTALRFKASPIFKPHISQLIKHIEKLNDSNKELITTLTTVLKDTIALLEQKMSPHDYQQTADKMKGKPSLALNILGGFMMTLGVLAMAAAITLAVMSLSFILIASSAAVSTVALTAGGVSFFAARRKGLSQEMFNLAKDNQTQFKGMST